MHNKQVQVDWTLSYGGKYIGPTAEKNVAKVEKEKLTNFGARAERKQKLRAIWSPAPTPASRQGELTEMSLIANINLFLQTVSSYFAPHLDFMNFPHLLFKMFLQYYTLPITYGRLFIKISKRKIKMRILLIDLFGNI